jgi:hypothetical protein
VDVDYFVVGGREKGTIVSKESAGVGLEGWV